VTTPAADIPYLLWTFGTPLLDVDSKPCVDVIVDRWGLPLCGICTTGVLFGQTPYSCGSAADHHQKLVQPWSQGVPVPPRCYWFRREVPDDVRARLCAYLAEPRCSIVNHAWWESAEIARREAAVRTAERELEEARRRLEEQRALAPGWSVGDRG